MSNGFPQRRPQALGHPDGVAGVGDVLQQDRELVAAEARQRDPALVRHAGGPARTGRLQPAGDRHQQAVGRQRAEAVVDRLEAIEAEDEDRKQLVLAPLRPLDRAVEQVDEQEAVRQSGQRIGDLGVGDVGERSGQPRHHALAVPHRRAAAEHPAERAVAMQDPVLALVVGAAVRSRCARQRLLHARDVVGVDARQPFVGADADRRTRRIPASPSSAATSTPRSRRGSSPTVRRWRRAPRARSAPRSRADPRPPICATGACGYARARPGNRSAWSRSRWRRDETPRRCRRPAVLAVTMMTGSSVCERVSRRRASTSSPLMPGISTSSSTRSNARVAGERQRLVAAGRHARRRKPVARQPARQRVPIGLVVVDDQERTLAGSPDLDPLQQQRSIFPRSCWKRTGLVSKSSPPAASAMIAIVGHRVGAQHDDRNVAGRARRPSAAASLPIRRCPGRPRSIRMRSGNSAWRRRHGLLSVHGRERRDSRAVRGGARARRGSARCLRPP